MMIKRIVYIMLVAWAATLTAAAQLPHSYTCDFEDDAENALWQLNKPKNEAYTWVNQWAIGSATASLGQKSLYISPDLGETAKYVKTDSRVMIAWRELTLEAGRYDIAFDWKCGGDSTRAALLTAWVPESEYDNMFCMLSDDYNANKWVANNMLQFDCHGILAGMPIWAHAVDTLYSDGTPHRLVFLFVYSSSAQMLQPGPCVDNIMLARNNCGEPTDKLVTMSGQTVSLSWQSEAESFNLRLHRMGETKVTEVKNIKQNNYSASLQEGIYDIQIQVICDGDTSAWYGFPPAIVHEALCFDYLDLTDDRCFYSEKTGDHELIDTVLVTPGKIDYGFASVASRHTVHYIPGEIDARTLNSIDMEGNPVPALKTIPEGALASVRIGSWEEHARAARVVYDFTIDAREASVLMLQYAMVLQYADHGEHQRPRMMIDIVDAATNKSLEPCMVVDLASEVGGEGWFRVPYDLNSLKPNAKDVCWRDWATLGLNLAEHHGKHVKVLITVLGCEMSAHYGYAYFTLTCTSGQIQGMHCGWEPTNQFIAPEGFNYRWYKVSEPKVTLGTSNIMDVDYKDTCTYAVDMIYKSNDKCGFALYANATPRFPIPEATYAITQHDCGNYITFNNTSHIRTHIYYTGEDIDTPFRPEYIGWNFDGATPSLDTPEQFWSPSFRLPDDRQDFLFKLYAGVGLCLDSLYIPVHVSAVSPDSVVDVMQACAGSPYQYKGVYYVKDTLIKERGYNRIGCDSLHVTDLRFVEAIYDTITASITDGETYLFNGEQLSEPGEYDSGALISTAGCDSFVHLILDVFVPLQMEITSVENPCDGASSYLIETHARKGLPDKYTLTYAEEAEQAGFVQQSGALTGGEDNTITVTLPADAKPGYYPFTILFDSENNGTFECTGELAIYYSSSLIRQRWDDVLGILNAEYNGGYDFQSFRWYRNGVAIEGATDPYLYVQEKLKSGDIYTVELGLEGDERLLSTCGYIVPAQQQSPAATTSIKMIQGGEMYIYVNGQIYNAQGVRVR